MSDVVIDGICTQKGLTNICFFFLFVLAIIFIIIFKISFLEENLGAQLFQKFIGLVEQFIYFRIFGFLKLFKIFLNVVFLQQGDSSLLFFQFNIIGFLFSFFVDVSSLIDEFLSLFFLLSMKIKELFLMNSHHFQHFLVLPLLSLLIITFHLILKFFNPIAYFSISL